MKAVEFKNINKSYGKKSILENINFSFPESNFIVLFGSPGCGKSVLLRLICGLEKPDSGTVLLREKDASSSSPGNRNIGYVPQSFALYPHWKVYDNIAYPLKMMDTPKKEIDRIVHQTSESLHITQLLKKMPNQLSGGEKQRVALARGIAKETNIYVLDDPLTGLDFKLREQLFDDLKEMQERLGATFIYTTSDPLECLMLANEVYVLNQGKIIENGPIENVFYSPQNKRTMEMLGFPSANLVEGKIESASGNICVTDLFQMPVKLQKEDNSPVGNVSVCFRPESLRINPENKDGLVTFESMVTLNEDLGGEVVIHLNANKHSLRAVSRQDEYKANTEKVIVGIPMGDMVVFDNKNGKRIGVGGM